MRLAVLPFVVIAVRMSVLVEGTMRPREPQESSSSRSEASAGFYQQTSRSTTKGIHTLFLVILPVRTDRSNFVLIFDLKRRRFLCMDLKGHLYNSILKEGENCVFQRLWFDLVNHQVLCSLSGGWLLKLDGGELKIVGQQRAESSTALWERLRVKRWRRSHEVNPSDPLRSQSDPSHSVKDHVDADHRQPEQDQAGAVSKETINSCDDPLRVLQSNGPVSPIKTNIADRPDQD